MNVFVFPCTQWNFPLGSVGTQAAGEAEAQVPGLLPWPPRGPSDELVLPSAVNLNLLCVRGTA